MMKVTIPGKVSLKDIDLEDDAFSISYPKFLETLKTSIQEIGLLTPLILRSKNSSLQIISGYRRGIVLKELGVDFIPAYIFKDGELDNEEALRLGILENLYTREINHIEISNSLFKLEKDLSIEPEKIIETYLPLFGLEKSMFIFKKFISLQNLIDGIKTLAVVKKFPLKTLAKLSLLSDKDQESFLELATELSLGFNLVNEFLTLLEEIAAIDRVSISDLLLDKSVNDILSIEDINRDVKTKLLISLLKAMRYPHIHDFKKSIKSNIKNLHLPHEIAMDIPENFEGGTIAMRFKFKNKKDYQEILSKLIEISDSEDFSKILEMI